MTGTSMLVFSFAFLLYAISPSYANYTKEEMPSKSDYALVPVNKDGSINIKISEEQVNEIKPPAVQSINLEQLRGKKIAMYDYPANNEINVLCVQTYGTTKVQNYVKERNYPFDWVPEKQ